MKEKLKTIWSTINIFRTVPAILLYSFSPSKEIVKKDIIRWVEIVLLDSIKKPLWRYLNILLLYYPEFRSLFYYRMKKDNFLGCCLVQIFYPSLKTLYIQTEEIGAGLVIFHGFSTIIYAKSIGENCTIYQQVTIGKTTDCPIIEDRVIISAGAIVIGPIRVGKNSIVGANATVVKDVPQNCVVVGNPAFITKRDGFKVKELTLL